ncbi:MAG TPA: hypothetical protein VK488_06645 [Gaiellaceae bacterium]|nr:hypothetical protein [Gaiellaceae bacterium]
MTKADQLVDRAATRLREIANKAAREGGVAAKLAQPLADDAAFLRKLKPSLILARAKGEARTDGKPVDGAVSPSEPQPGKRRKPKSGPNPFLVVGIALVAGVALAKIIDWKTRGHADD